MSRYLISTMPATGHVTPATPLAARLVAEGHEVVWHTGSRYAGTVTATGATFVPFDRTPDFDALPVEPDRGDRTGLSALRKLFVDRVAGQVADYERILADFAADALVVDMCSLGAATLYERGGPPYGTLGINPLVTPDPEVPPFQSRKPPPRSAAGRTANRFAHRLAKVYMNRLAGPLDGQRAVLGMPPLPRPRDVGALLRSPLLHLQPTTPAFEYPRRAAYPQVHFVGPLLPATPSGVRLPDWWAELDGGRPVVHVTQGTVATDPAALVAPTVAALAGSSLLVVVTGPAPDPLPPNVRTAPFILHALLLPKVDVMVSNGGYNGVLTALAHGVPLVVAGASEDKPAVCGRVAWSGVGVDLGTDRPTPDRVRAAVDRVRHDPSYRDSARRVRDDFARHDPAGESVRLLDRLAAGTAARAG